MSDPKKGGAVVTVASAIGRQVKLRCDAYGPSNVWELLGVDQGCLILRDVPSAGRVDIYLIPLSSVQAVLVEAGKE